MGADYVNVAPKYQLYYSESLTYKSESNLIIVMLIGSNDGYLIAMVDSITPQITYVLF